MKIQLRNDEWMHASQRKDWKRFDNWHMNLKAFYSEGYIGVGVTEVQSPSRLIAYRPKEST